MSANEFRPLINTYDRFLEAFVWRYSTSNPNPVFPEYQAQIDAENNSSDIQYGIDDVETLYIKHFLANMPDVQEGLVKYIKAVCKCCRYGRDDYYYCDGDYSKSAFVRHIKLFIERGASIKPCTAYLMKTFDPQYLEDFSTIIEMKMPLVDAFWDDLDQDYIYSLTDWKTIKPAHWETIVSGLDMEDGYPLTATERENEPAWFYMYMKYVSKKLKTLC
jgi:hypothetical protein